jgi:protein SCO1/2
MRMNNFFLFSFLFLMACDNPSLPILGNRDVVIRKEGEKEMIDTVYQTIPDFQFQDQYGHHFTTTKTNNKIYVADFFFVTCPSICPRMKRNLLKVNEAFGTDSNFLILSHTIDPEHDSVSVLFDYADKLGVNNSNWYFLRGERAYTYELAEKAYYASAQVDSTEPGGFVHSGGLILIDKYRRVRGIYDGTNANETDKLINDIKLLQNEKE